MSERAGVRRHYGPLCSTLAAARRGSICIAVDSQTVAHLHVKMRYICPVALAHALVVKEGVLAHRDVRVYPLLEVVQVIEWTVEWHRLYFRFYAREATALE